MRKKIVRCGLVKGLLVGLLCCLLLGSGAFVGKALADGGKFNASVVCAEGRFPDAAENVSLKGLKDWAEWWLDGELSNEELVALKAKLGATAKRLKKTDEKAYVSLPTYLDYGYGPMEIEIICVEPYPNYTSETPSAATSSLKDSIVALNTAYLMSINNLSKRMGDLRGGEASNIPWVRFSRNNNTMGAVGFNGNQYQVGYDREIARDKKSRQLLGISLDINEGSTKLTKGHGDMDGISVGVYYTKIYESGHYFDFILRQGRFSDDVKALDLSFPSLLTAFDYGINATTLSGEYGYRFKLGKSGFYLEPQAELVYGYLSSANVKTNNNESLKLESNNKFISRVGLAFGKRNNHINYYARVSQFRDWGSAKSTVIQDGTASSVDLAKNWWEVSLGGGWHINNVSYFYAEISKMYKDIQNSLNFNLGFRFSL